MTMAVGLGALPIAERFTNGIKIEQQAPASAKRWQGARDCFAAQPGDRQPEFASRSP
jgi:hypothetical protein